MFDLYQQFAIARKQESPCLDESIKYILDLEKDTVFKRLTQAKEEHRVLVQPRCGVGSHIEMRELLMRLEQDASPDILSLTIDAHTRLLRFDVLDKIIESGSKNLNGFPLISRGWKVGRTLNGSVRAPIEVRHGSPDARLLFGATIASGITSFEGGGIGYNIPYCKKVLIRDSLKYWKQVDRFAGELSESGVIVDREFFGTLTAVLMPPSISIAMAFLEAWLAARERVKSLSIACCQTGNITQDIAMLRAVSALGKKLLPSDVSVFPVLHQFMGAFPAGVRSADSLIALGALTARLGHAAKMINKTNEEAFGIPTTQANTDGIHLSDLFNGIGFSDLPIDESRIYEEQHFIEIEVLELITPVLEADDPIEEICKRFESGELDVPFSASLSAKADVLPARDASGAIRIARFGNLAMSKTTQSRHSNQLNIVQDDNPTVRFEKLRDDILFFCKTNHHPTIERKHSP